MISLNVKNLPLYPRILEDLTHARISVHCEGYVHHCEC
jgi:hypothetical protein